MWWISQRTSELIDHFSSCLCAISIAQQQNLKDFWTIVNFIRAFWSPIVEILSLAAVSDEGDEQMFEFRILATWVVCISIERHKLP
jgi:hypothetical protein